MIKMHKKLLAGFIILLISACRDNQKIWLQDYKKTRCSWDKVQANFNRDSIANTAKYIAKLAEIQIEVQKIEARVNYEIKLLDHKIGQINIKYLNESRMISEEQERINGHNSTRVYESRISENDKNNDLAVLPLENKKELLQLKLNNDKMLQELFAKEKQLRQQIVSTTSALKEKYKTRFNSLKNKLENQNNDFRIILGDLERADKESFKNQREKINLNPCK